jgi:hypothetical protein
MVLGVVKLSFDVVNCMIVTDGFSQELVKVYAKIQEPGIPCLSFLPCSLPIRTTSPDKCYDPVPSFAVGLVDSATRVAFGAEQQAGAGEDVLDRKNKKDLLGDDVGHQEIHLGGQVCDGAATDAAVRVDVVQPVQQSGGGLDLHPREF